LKGWRLRVGELNWTGLDWTEGFDDDGDDVVVVVAVQGGLSC